MLFVKNVIPILRRKLVLFVRLILMGYLKLLKEKNDQLCFIKEK